MLRLFRAPSALHENELSHSACTIGSFDGLHKGHISLIRKVVATAKREHYAPVVVSFYPHPLSVLRSDYNPEKISSLRQKMRILESLGVEAFYLIRFTPEVAAMSPEEFVQRYLIANLNCKALVVGSDFSIGKNRSGNTEVLRELCNSRGMLFEIASLLHCADKEKIGSREIRRLLREGNITEAEVLLGRPVILEGKVVKGDGRGKTLGFPTANLHLPFPTPLRHGVYAARATIGEEANLPAVVNVGTRPTFHTQKGKTPPQGPRVSIEAHLLVERQLSCYGEILTLEFCAFLRDEKRFPSIEELKTQILADINRAHEVLQ